MHKVVLAVMLFTASLLPAFAYGQGDDTTVTVAQTNAVAADVKRGEGAVPLVGVEPTASAPSSTAVPVVQVSNNAPISVTGNVLIDRIVGYIIALVSAMIPFLAVIIPMWLKHKWDIDEEKSKHAIEEILRGGFQTSLENGAGWLIQKMGTDVAAMTDFKPSTPAVAEAIEIVKRGAKQAIDHFAPTPEDIAKRLQAKVGIILGLTDEQGNPVAPASNIIPLNIPKV